MYRWLLVLMFAIAALFAAHPRATRAADRKPDVLFIAIDDLNDWISPLGGHSQSVTPNLGRLAKRGVLFTHAYCAAPACNPSRAALMTGILPSTSGIYHNSDPWRSSPVLKNAVTLPQHFRAAGYQAIGSGKIYHGAFPDPPSWDDYWPSKTKQKPEDPLPDRRPLNGLPKTAHFDWGPVDVDDSKMGDAQVADWVTNQLQASHGKPQFLACGFYRPHLPWYVPTKYFDLYPLDKVQLPKVLANDLDDIPDAGVRMAKPQGDHAKVVEHHQWQRAVQAYLASIRFTDTQLGRVLDTLDKSGRADRTIIVLWTDHGWNLGEKQHWRKFALWEDTTRTPLMIVVPKGIAPGLTDGTAAGTRVDKPVGLIDIYPTLIELCGLPARDGLAGESLVPLLKDPAAPRERPVLTTHGRNNHALRSDRWRYIRYEDGSEELYDHTNDPDEWRNLARDGKYDEVKQSLAKWLPTKNVAEVKGKAGKDDD